MVVVGLKNKDVNKKLVSEWSKVFDLKSNVFSIPGVRIPPNLNNEGIKKQTFKK